MHMAGVVATTVIVPREHIALPFRHTGQGLCIMKRPVIVRRHPLRAIMQGNITEGLYIAGTAVINKNILLDRAA